MMNIPTENPTLPEDLQKQYDNAKNIITLMNADVVRMKELKNSMEGEIIEKNKQMVGATEELNKVLADLAYNEETLATLIEKVKIEKDTFDNLTISIRELGSSLDEKAEVLSAKEKELAVFYTSLSEKEVYLDAKEKVLTSKEEELNARESKLREFVASI